MEKALTHEQSVKTQSFIRIADELESIADYLEAMAHYKIRFNQNFALVGEMQSEFTDFMTEIWDYFNICCKGLYEKSVISRIECEEQSEKLRLKADSIRDKHLERISKAEHDPLAALTYSDMVVALRKIRAHSLNVAQAIFSYRGV